MINGIKANHMIDGNYSIEVTTDRLTFAEPRVNPAFLNTSLEAYENCDDEDALYTHMLYVRLYGEYSARIDYLKEKYPVDDILKYHAFEISEMQDILYALEENNINADRAVELLQLPGDLMAALYSIRESRDASPENEEIMDMLEFNNDVQAIALSKEGSR